MPLVKVKLLGVLGKKFGREFELDIRTPAEAIRAIASQINGFAGFLESSESQGLAYRVVTLCPEGLDEQGLLLPIEGQRLAIAPVVIGSGAFGRILLGVALIGAAFLIPGGFLGLSATTIGLVGASLVLGGISELLTAKPKTPKDKKNSESFLFDRAQEVGNQGSPVPVLYGTRYITDLAVISSGLSVDEIPIE